MKISLTAYHKFLDAVSHGVIAALIEQNEKMGGGSFSVEIATIEKMTRTIGEVIAEEFGVTEVYEDE